MSIKLQQARKFAVEAHGDQRYGDEPYVVHLDHVLAVLQRFGIEGEDILVAGLLHDTIEDTNVTQEQIAEPRP